MQMDDHMQSTSLATGQRSLGDPNRVYPLWPPLLEGCRETSNDQVQYPLEITYEYSQCDPALFEQPPCAGLQRWQPLLPPLDSALDLGAGGTPLIQTPSLAESLYFDGEVYLKDESQNPTWSHKDRLNYCAVSAALETDAPGIVVASSGNHGSAAAAHAARAGLPCIVVTATELPNSMARFLHVYDAMVVATDQNRRWDVLRTIYEECGFHPVSNLTTTHTGHPFGPEGYKTIAYEIYRQLDARVPGTVFVPTGYAELLYGVWKGFRELSALGVSSETPRMVACEPAARAPLSRALAEGKPTMSVGAEPTDAYSIGVTVSGYRGVRAIEESNGRTYRVTDDRLRAAQQELRDVGHWQELSGTAGVAGLLAAQKTNDGIEPPVVCLACSGGFKDPASTVSAPEPGETPIHEFLNEQYDFKI